MPATMTAAQRVTDALDRRNAAAAPRFGRAAPVIAATAQAMAERFHRGGRLLALGVGAWTTDAQHVAVEFVHPVIVGKRALPAFDVSALDDRAIATLLRPDDMLIVLGSAATERAVPIAAAAANGVLLVIPFGDDADIGAAHPSLQQEWYETWYHTLWESIHVFLERQTLGHDVGSASFLYPFLGTAAQDDGGLVADVAASVVAKVGDDAMLRRQVAESQSEAIAAAVTLIARRAALGGTLLTIGNGGSATDANDFAFDCVSPAAGERSIAALSLASDAATITAIANDVGNELIFVRQLMAHGRAGDIVFAISTSGGSRNVIAALEHARKSGIATIALLGYDGGEILRRNLADVTIVVGSDYIPRIQEVQASVYHIIRELLEDSDGED